MERPALPKRDFDVACFHLAAVHELTAVKVTLESLVRGWMLKITSRLGVPSS